MYPIGSLYVLCLNSVGLVSHMVVRLGKSGASQSEKCYGEMKDNEGVKRPMRRPLEAALISCGHSREISNIVSAASIIHSFLYYITLLPD